MKLDAFARLYRNRSITFALEPERDVVPEGQTYRLIGKDPTFRLSRPSDRLPQRWCLVFLDAERDVGALRPAIVVRTEAASEGVRLSVTPTADRPDGLLHHVPATARELELHLTPVAGAYELRGVRIREIGWIQVLCRVLLNGLAQLVSEPRRVRSRLRRAVEVWRQNGPRGILAVFVKADVVRSFDYAEWIVRYGSLNSKDRDRIARRVRHFSDPCVFSILMPVYNPPERFLRAAIESVRAQLHPHWELCVANDASTEQYVTPVLAEYARVDSRIRVTQRRENGGIVAASRTALEMARGEFVALLDHDDELAPHALYLVAEELAAHPDADLVFTDEDKIDELGKRFEPWFKSDFNPDLMLSQNNVFHLGVFRASLVREIGGFRVGFDGSQDYDLALRVIAKTSAERVRHIPHVLYHWRAIRGSTAFHPDDSAKRAIQDFVRGRAVVESTDHPGYYRLVYPLPAEPPLVSVIVPTKDRLDLLEPCVDGLLNRTDYPKLELGIVNNRSERPETHRYLERVSRDPRVVVLEYDKDFDYAALNNWAVSRMKGSLVALVNNDIEVIAPGWLDEMVRHALRPEVGAVGAKLYYRDDSIQHAGIVMGIGDLAGHAHQRLPRRMSGYFGRAILVQNFSAVTAACMVLRRAVFEEVGGFDAETFPVAFNDVDLCLRIGERGYRIVWTPYAELYHHESASVGLASEPGRREQFHVESERLRERWRKVMDHDPAYNPNLTLRGGDFSPAFPPRAKKPWLEGAG